MALVSLDSMHQNGIFLIWELFLQGRCSSQSVWFIISNILVMCAFFCFLFDTELLQKAAVILGGFHSLKYLINFLLSFIYFLQSFQSIICLFSLFQWSCMWYLHNKHIRCMPVYCFWCQNKYSCHRKWYTTAEIFEREFFQVTLQQPHYVRKILE